MTKANRIIRYSLVAVFFAAYSSPVLAQGWPTFDVSHTASEITGLVSDIQKTYEMPMEIQGLGDLTSSVGQLGNVTGVNVGGMTDEIAAKSKLSLSNSEMASKAKDKLDSGVEYAKTESGEFSEKAKSKVKSRQKTSGKENSSIEDVQESQKEEGLASSDNASYLKTKVEGNSAADQEEKKALENMSAALAVRAEKLSKMKASFGGVGVSMDGTPLTVEAQKGTVSDTVDYIKTGSGDFATSETTITAQEIKRVKDQRRNSYVDANKEAYAMAVSMRANGPDKLQDRIDEINEYNKDAEDKRATLTANTLSIVAICNELIDIATLSVADLKRQATSEIYSLDNIVPTQVDDEEASGK